MRLRQEIAALQKIRKISNFPHRTCLPQPHADLQQILRPSEWAFIVLNSNSSASKHMLDRLTYILRQTYILRSWVWPMTHSGTMVTSDNRGPRFKLHHWPFWSNNYFLLPIQKKLKQRKRGRGHSSQHSVILIYNSGVIPDYKIDPRVYASRVLNNDYKVFLRLVDLKKLTGG